MNIDKFTENNLVVGETYLTRDNHRVVITEIGCCIYRPVSIGEGKGIEYKDLEDGKTYKTTSYYFIDSLKAD